LGRKNRNGKEGSGVAKNIKAKGVGKKERREGGTLFGRWEKKGVHTVLPMWEGKEMGALPKLLSNRATGPIKKGKTLAIFKHGRKKQNKFTSSLRGNINE